MIIVCSIVICIVILLWIFGGLRETLGDFVNGIFPKEPLKAGDKVAVFLDGKHNRTATISRIHTDKIFIYDRVALPVDYRGKFYARGVDTNDGSKLIYLAHRKHFRFVRAAELVRYIFNVQDDEDMMPVTEEEQIEAAENDEEAEK